MSSDPNHMQTMLEKLPAYPLRKSLTVNTQKLEVMCHNSHTNNLPPLFMMARSFPSQTPSDIWARFVTDISIWLLRLMQCFMHSKLVLSASNRLYGSMTSPTGYTSTYRSLRRSQFLLVCMQARFGLPHSFDRAKKWTILDKNGCWQEDFDGQGLNPIMVRHTRVWSR